MTTLDAALPADDSLGREKSASRWDQVEAWLERGSEWLNPILVKEARQALKSRQFVITFTLLMLFGWAWTVLGVFWSMPGISYGAEGKGMLYGYFLVLAIPLIVVVPFSAFRSLAAEREDGTYELISITSLNARQIVSGKLGSAVLQMLVYFSALAPCVAFTYLLRGVDVFSIFFVLFHTFCNSLLLSTLGLLVATASRARHWQVLLSVLLLMLLFLAAFGWVMFVYMSLDEEIWRADLWEFWVAEACIFTFSATYYLFFLGAGASQITFESDNRSSRLRWVMFAQQVLFIGWMTYFWLLAPETVVAIMIIGGINWMILGSFMVGEYPQLSPRVRRELPQSFLGRMLLTWFNPGSGSGYVFAITNLFGLLVFTFVLIMATDMFNRRIFGINWLVEIGWFSALVFGYAVSYLGATRLLVLLTRQVAQVGLVFSLLVTVLLLIMGTVPPLIFQWWLFDFRVDDYTALQVTNWWWTLIEAADGDITLHPLVIICVFGTALVVFIGNLIFAAKEVAQTRVAAPQRVLEEDAALRPQHRKPASPWDDEPAPQ